MKECINDKQNAPKQNTTDKNMNGGEGFERNFKSKKITLDKLNNKRVLYKSQKYLEMNELDTILHTHINDKITKEYDRLVRLIPKRELSVCEKQHNRY